ncbi:hypothetical protein ZWY2020_040133 [Hordeum vulgare]|nr:hypothetical protein ZWY2020_040133 [Hordeum vulgare]
MDGSQRGVEKGEACTGYSSPPSAWLGQAGGGWGRRHHQDRRHAAASPPGRRKKTTVPVVGWAGPDPRTEILPSTTRTRKELPSSSALDSPSVLSKFATSPPARNLDMSRVLDDATSASHDAYDDAMLDTAVPDDAMLDTTLPDDAMPDTALPLGAFLDAQIARIAARCDDTSKSVDTIEVEPATMPELRVMPERYVMEGEIAEDFLAFMSLKRL